MRVIIFLENKYGVFQFVLIKKYFLIDYNFFINKQEWLF